MINIDFSQAVALYALILISALLVFWVLGRKDKSRDLTLDAKFIWFCSVCAYTYINTREEIISTCPRCGSYNKK